MNLINSTNFKIKIILYCSPDFIVLSFLNFWVAQHILRENIAEKQDLGTAPARWP